MHCFTHRVVTTEGEGYVRNTAGDFGAGKVLLDPLSGIEKIDRVVVVLFNTGGNGKNIGIKNDVLWVEANFIHKNTVGALTDADFLLVGGSLPLFIKGHDHGCRAKLHDGAGVRLEGFLTLFE